MSSRLSTLRLSRASGQAVEALRVRARYWSAALTPTSFWAWASRETNSTFRRRPASSGGQGGSMSRPRMSSKVRSMSGMKSSSCRRSSTGPMSTSFSSSRAAISLAVTWARPSRISLKRSLYKPARIWFCTASMARS